jgi:vacuolar-type H+-ATPase subunit F/Vma7
MSRAIALGERAFVLGFKGVGFEVVPAKTVRARARELARIARERDVGACFGY